MKRFLIIYILIFSSNLIFGQELPPDLQKKVDEYKIQVADFKSQGNNSAAVNYLNKIGNTYWQNNIPDEAISAYNEALVLLENSANTSAKVNINNQLGSLYMVTQNYAKAEEHFKTSYDYIKDFSEKSTIASALTNLGQAQQNQAKYNEAINSFNEALTIGLELDNLTMCKTIAIKMANCHKALGDENQYFYYYQLSVSFDSRLKQNQIEDEQQRQRELALQLQLEAKNKQRIKDSLALQQQINENNIIQLQFLNKEKELQAQEIEKQQQELEYQKEIDKARKTTISILGIGLILILIAFFFILRLFIVNKKQKNKLQVLNNELSKKNNQIEKQKEELVVKNQLLTDKNEEIEQHRKELLKKNTQINDSIKYASRIQKAILPVKQAITQNFKNVFIFYRPRDVVSGDFYWFTKINDKKIIAAIDCTGHSVPGAFVSMIANTLLNEIVKAKQIVELDQILNDLHNGVVETLNNTDSSEELSDGMDITMFRFDDNSRTAKFASANHTAIVFVDGEKKIIDGDYFSIGGHFENIEVKFKQQEINLGKKSQIYMFSDGFPDQFNNNKRRYMSRNFYKLLERVNQKSFKKQEKILAEEFDNWKGNFRQIDDVIVIGLEI